MVFLAAEELKSLGRLKKLARAIHKNAAIWVVYPMGQKHIREMDVVKAGKSLGVVDNKVQLLEYAHGPALCYPSRSPLTARE